MQLSFFKRKQLSDYLNNLADFRFSLVQGDVDGKITQYRVVLDDGDGDGTPMTDEEAFNYLEVVADDQLEAVLNALRFIRVIRKRQRDDMADLYAAAMTERKGVFEGLRECVRRGGVAKANAGPSGPPLAAEEEVIDDPRDAQKTLVDEGGADANVVESLATEAIDGLWAIVDDPAARRNHKLEDADGKPGKEITDLFAEVLAKAYTAGRYDEQELHRD